MKQDSKFFLFFKVITDMNPTGNISVVEGAETAIYLALLPPDSNVQKGAYWYKNKVYEWDNPNLNLSVFT
jgi:hypothetical protein